jgi:hypothetical protein
VNGLAKYSSAPILIARDHDHFRILAVLADVADQIKTAHFRHFQIGNHQVDRCGLGDAQGFGHAWCGEHGVALGGQVPLQDLDRVGHVIHYQNRFFPVG